MTVKFRPVRGTVVTVMSSGVASDGGKLTYTGRVTCWSAHDVHVFWMMIEKVNGVDKAPGTYQDALPFTIQEIVE